MGVVVICLGLLIRGGFFRTFEMSFSDFNIADFYVLGQLLTILCFLSKSSIFNPRVRVADFSILYQHVVVSCDIVCTLNEVGHGFLQCLF